MLSLLHCIIVLNSEKIIFQANFFVEYISKSVLSVIVTRPNVCARSSLFVTYILSMQTCPVGADTVVLS